MQWLKRAVGALLATLAIAGSAHARDAIPAPVAQALRAAGVPAGSVGIAVHEVGASRPLLSVNAAVPRNPASTMKLVTTYAGLQILGPAYRWRTEAYLSGALREGVLDGDLLIKGYGDPKLTLEAFWLLLRSLRDRGLKDIRGDLVLDRSHFQAGEHDPGRFDGEALRPYNVGPDALLLNFNAIRFAFVPEPEHSAVRVFAEPPLAAIVSVLRLTQGACGEWRDRLKADFRAAPTPRALFTGSYDASCGERHWHVAPLAPAQYADGLFRLLWKELGGTLSGGVREGLLSAQARPFAKVESPTLAEVVRDINKFSNNVMARQLFLTLAAEQAGLPARAENAQRAIKAWLAAQGLEFPELVLENGSGLSRTERISAANLATLLVAAFRSPVMPEFMASLPLVAVDGTMRRRLKNDTVAGFAHIKTGTLADARAIAGYVLDTSARRHAVAMIVNHANAAQTQAAQDALITWIHQRAAARARKDPGPQSGRP